MDPQKTSTRLQHPSKNMAIVLRVFLSLALIGATLSQDAGTGASELVREPRGHRKRLCRKYGICGNQGFGGYQGQQQGYQGYPPAINIGISQSQSSASAGGGGYSSGYYPNNYQYNGIPNQGYGEHGGYQGGYGGYHNQGRPGYFSNGQGSYNNQFNGNYYGPGAGNGGGYGFQGPSHGGFYDEPQNEPGHESIDDNIPNHHQDDHGDYNDNDNGNYGSQGPHGTYGNDDYAAAGAFAFAGRKNN